MHFVTMIAKMLKNLIEGFDEYNGLRGSWPSA